MQATYATGIKVIKSTLTIALVIASTASNAGNNIIEIIGIRERDERGIEALFDALQHARDANLMAQLERDMQTVADSVEVATENLCNKAASGTKDSLFNRQVAANRAARKIIEENRQGFGTKLSFVGVNFRVIYGDGSSEVWAIQSPGQVDRPNDAATIVEPEPKTGTQLPANPGLAEACAAVG
jgi:hypothetical protein